MKKISCVLAALATVAVAAPTVASAQGQASPLLGRLKENGPLTGVIFLTVKQPPDLPLPLRASRPSRVRAPRSGVPPGLRDNRHREFPRRPRRCGQMIYVAGVPRVRSPH